MSASNHSNPGVQAWTASSRQLRRTLQAHGFRQSLQYAIDRAQRETDRVAAREANPLTRLTASEYFALRKQVRVDVESYLLDHGQDGVTNEMVARWCGEATQACLRDMVAGIVNDPPSPEALERARERIKQIMGDGSTARQREARANGTHGIAQHVPAAPSPSYIAQHGVAELDKLDIFVELNKLFRDANLMRSAAIRVGPDGVEKVMNPRTFDKSISRRLEILATSINTQKELWDLKRMEAFYGTIIETIAACAPEVAQEIQRRLSVLNIHVGMT